MRQQRVVVITGASAGIGRATAREFAACGDRVALLARDEARLEDARRDVIVAGGEAMVIPTDVADEQQVEAAAAQVEQAWGQIDVWVNNAMTTVFSSFEEIAPEDFKRVTEVTYLGYVWGTRAALKRMTPRNQGVIIQVGSALAYRSIPLQSAYCGAKAAIRGFTDSLRSELIHDRSQVQLSMVQLSAFNTPQFDWGRTTLHKQPQPLPPIYHPRLAARAICWVAEHPRRELWVGQPAAKAIVGNRVIAPLLDHLMARQAYSGQQTDQPVAANRQDNLYEPVAGDFGAEGRFGERSRNFSLQLWLNMHRGKLLAASLGLAATAGLVLLRRQHRETGQEDRLNRQEGRDYVPTRLPEVRQAYRHH